MTPFRFILLTLLSFRATRVIATDDWPISEWFRNKVATRFGENSAWSTLVECGWCAGTYITAAIFIFDHFITIPTVVLAAGAAMALVGYLSVWDERP